MIMENFGRIGNGTWSIRSRHESKDPPNEKDVVIDDLLWTQLQWELSASNVKTNVGAKEVINKFLHANNINVEHKGKGKHEGIDSSGGMRRVSFSSSNDLRKLHLSSAANSSADNRTEGRNHLCYKKKEIRATFHNLRRHSDSTGPRQSEKVEFMRNILSEPICASEHHSFPVSGLNEDWEKMDHDISHKRSNVNRNVFLTMLEENKSLPAQRIEPIQKSLDIKNRNQSHKKVTRVPWVQKASTLVHKVVNKVKEQEFTPGSHEGKSDSNSRLQAWKGHSIVEISDSAGFLTTSEEHHLYTLNENNNDLLRHKNTTELAINCITAYDGNLNSIASNETEDGKHPEIPGCLHGKKSDQSVESKITCQTLYYDPW